MLSPPKVIPIRMLRRRSIVPTTWTCFKPTPLKFKLYKNELKSLRAQLVQGSGSRKGPPRLFYGLSHDAMVGEYVLSSAHNSIPTLEFAFSFCLSYVVTQEVNVAPKIFATRHVIQTNGFTSGSSPITKARGAQAVMA